MPDSQFPAPGDLSAHELTGKYPIPSSDAEVTGKHSNPLSPAAESILRGGVLTSGTPLVPGYDIVGELGRGGMGVVFKAWQVNAKRFVALKMVVPGAQTNVMTLRRFQSEGQAVARLNHPHIVRIYDVGEIDGWPFFSLEFCGGGTLAKKLAGTPMLPRPAAQMLEKIAQAVAAAHEQQIVHRDLKPANILLTPEGEPKIGDFGLAKRMDEAAGNTRTGSVMGTPSYIPPEQAAGSIRNVGATADIYALGAILYECLTGRPPFKGATAIDTLDLVRRQEVIPLRLFDSNIPAELEAICLKCLSRNPKSRYATAAEVADELIRFRKGEAVRARPPGAFQRLLAWARDNPRRAFIATIAVVLFAWAVAGNVLLAMRLGEVQNQLKTLEAVKKTNSR